VWQTAFWPSSARLARAFETKAFILGDADPLLFGIPGKKDECVSVRCRKRQAPSFGHPFNQRSGSQRQSLMWYYWLMVKNRVPHSLDISVNKHTILDHRCMAGRASIVAARQEIITVPFGIKT